MTDTSKEAAWDALMNYQQADEEGIMVLVSRQAIHECKDERDALRKAFDSYSYIGRDGKMVLAKNLEDERDALRAQLQAARNAALEEAALWAESEGLFRTRDEIRALKSTSAEGVRDAGAGHSIPRHSIPKHFSDVGGTELFARAISRALKRGKFYGSPIIPVEPEDIPNDRSD